jgi:hypothetical protein
MYWRFCGNIVADDSTMLPQNLQYNLHYIWTQTNLYSASSFYLGPFCNPFWQNYGKCNDLHTVCSTLCCHFGSVMLLVRDHILLDLYFWKARSTSFLSAHSAYFIHPIFSSWGHDIFSWAAFLGLCTDGCEVLYLFSIYNSDPYVCNVSFPPCDEDIEVAGRTNKEEP